MSSGHSRSVLLAALLLTSVVNGCTAPSDVFGFEPGRLVYLWLSRQPNTSTDSTLYALVAETRRAPYYAFLAAESFTMSRRSDGAIFDWRHNGREGLLAIGGLGTTTAATSNYELTWRGTGARLGRGDLAPGDTLDLLIVVGDETISGTAVIPAIPVVNTATASTDSMITWQSDIRATAGYYLIVSPDSPDEVYTRDTTYRLRFNEPFATSGRVFVEAFDLNAWAYRSDTTASSAGLNGAFGVFGAVASTSVTVSLPARAYAP